MPNELAHLLAQTIATELPFLRAFTGTEASAAPQSAGAWSKKEELGHLIDSATNNHLRFVKAALEGGYEGPLYAQDEWVRLHGYAGIPWADIVELWYQYNLLLSRLVEGIPEERLAAGCKIGYDAPVTLGFLIDDYVLHMQHHVDHILSRALVTAYPRTVPRPVPDPS
jgi:DinB superfamily